MAPLKWDSHFSWEYTTPNGVCILPPPTVQPLPNWCGAHVAVEAFEARARLFCAKRGQMFPTLSIRHFIDILLDMKDKATTSMDKRRVHMEENFFQVLINKGVTSKVNYDAAPRQEGRHERYVEDLHHYKISSFTQHFMRRNFLHVDGSRKILNEIEDEGPVYGWFVYHPSFQTAADNGTIYYKPKEEEEEEEEEQDELMYEEEEELASELSGSSGGESAEDEDEDEPPAQITNKPPRPSTHAVLLFGFGSTGCKGLFDYQNNWGTPRSRGVMEAINIVSAIAPCVSFQSLYDEPEPVPAPAEST